MPDPKVSFLVINYNGRNFLAGCLESIRKQSYCDFETILVDNASNDGSVEPLRLMFPEIKIIQLHSNRGFAGGNNEGLKYCKGAYICLVNSDCLLEEHWLENMIYNMESHAELGMCACKVLFQKTLLINACGDGMTTSGKGYQIGMAQARGDYSVPKYVFGGYGAAMMLRRKMLDEIGIFDEDFFLFYEEDDLNFRAQLAGWKCLFIPSAVAYHKGSATARKIIKQAVYYCSRNAEWLWFKNMPKYFMFRYLHHKIVRDMVEPLRYFRYINWYIRGKVDAWKLIIVMYHKRKLVQSDIKANRGYMQSIFTSEWRGILFLTRRIISDIINGSNW